MTRPRGRSERAGRGPSGRAGARPAGPAGTGPKKGGCWLPATVIAAALVLGVSLMLVPLGTRVWAGRSLVAWPAHDGFMLALLVAGLILFVAVSFLTPGRGTARQGEPWRGVARQGTAWRAPVRQWQGAAREMGGWQAPGFEPPAPTREAWRGVAWLGRARRGGARQGRSGGWQPSRFEAATPTQWPGAVRSGSVGCAAARLGAAWQGRVDGLRRGSTPRHPRQVGLGRPWSARRGTARQGKARQQRAVPDLRSGTTRQQGVSHDHH